MAIDPAAIYTNLNPSAFAGVIFLNAGQVGGVTRLVADDLTLTGTAPHNLGWVQWTICNTNAATVTVRSLIRLYADNAGVPGNLVAGYNIAPFIGIPTNSCQPVSLRLPLSLQTTAPGGKIWAGITFDNADGATATATQMNSIGQGYFNPPESGSSADQFFLTTAAGDFLVNNPTGSVTTNAGGPVDNFGWDLPPPGCSQSDHRTGFRSTSTERNRPLVNNSQHQRSEGCDPIDGTNRRKFLAGTRRRSDRNDHFVRSERIRKQLLDGNGDARSRYGNYGVELR